MISVLTLGISSPDSMIVVHTRTLIFPSESSIMEFSNSVSELQNLDVSSFVVEVGSNDGIMLQNFVTYDIPCLGVEPSRNVAKVAKDKNIEVITEFFDQSLAVKISETYQMADAILSANVMCHIPYMHSIYDGIKALLKESGVFIFEDPYLGEIIEWVGWGTATWSLPSLVFAVWTVANLVPRSRSHHLWYKQRFSTYPFERKALIPRLW